MRTEAAVAATLAAGACAIAAVVLARRRALQALQVRLPKLTWLEIDLAVVREHAGARDPWTRHIPENVTFHSVTRTAEETSTVLDARCAPLESEMCRVEKGWVAFRLEGPLDFALVGVLARIGEVLASKQISIFAIVCADACPCLATHGVL